MRARYSAISSRSLREGPASVEEAGGREGDGEGSEDEDGNEDEGLGNDEADVEGVAEPGGTGAEASLLKLCTDGCVWERRLRVMSGSMGTLTLSPSKHRLSLFSPSVPLFMSVF
jgi:hypothetical protein